ncbi:MATE family efflux transporter [Huintestinicola sp.]
MTKQKTIDMTEGSLPKNILFFSLPLMLTQMLEVLFNLSDVAIAGKYADYIALGAVGSTTLLVSLFTGILIGVGSGVNVRVAHRLGAQKADGDTSATARTIYTAFAVCGVIGIIVCLVCGIFARPMLEALNTKDELIDGAVLYLHIYSLGMPAMALYNFGNGVLSACGDTKRPLVYLSAAGVLNVLLNLFFVIVCKMAADGVALASVIAQYVSAGLILRRLLTTDDSCRLRLSHRLFDKKACKGVLMIGVPTGMQNAIFAVANLFVQTGVNHFDAIMVSGNSAAANADTLIFNVMSAFYTACASFISRNHGAGKNDRIMKTYGISLAYSFAAGAVFGGSLLLFGRQFLSLFTNEPRVVEAGMQRVMIMGWSYCISAFMDCTIAASRGIGRSVVPTVIVIMGSCVFRVIWVYTVFAHFMTIPSLYLLYSFSWAITAAAEIAYFMHSYKKFIKAP